MATNQIRIKDFDEITTHTSDHSMTASASGRAEKRLVAAPRGCALAVLRVHNADGSALGADQTTKAVDFSTGNVRHTQGIKASPCYNFRRTTNEQMMNGKRPKAVFVVPSWNERPALQNAARIYLSSGPCRPLLKPILNTYC